MGACDHEKEDNTVLKLSTVGTAMLENFALAKKKQICQNPRISKWHEYICNPNFEKRI